MTDKQAKHTPTPWKMGGRYGNKGIEITSADGMRCLGMFYAFDDTDAKGNSGKRNAEGYANLQLAIAAVNAHSMNDPRPLLNEVADMVENFKTQKGEFIADRIRIRYNLGKYRKY